MEFSYTLVADSESDIKNGKLSVNSPIGKGLLGKELGDIVEIKVPVDDNCKIKFNTIDVDEDFQGIYYENIPITIKVNPKHDYEFIGWEGRDEITAEITFLPLENTVLKPILRPKKYSLLRDSLIINEISFYQPENDSTDEIMLGIICKYMGILPGKRK